MYTNVIVSKGKYNTDSAESIGCALKKFHEGEVSISDMDVSEYNHTNIRYFRSQSSLLDKKFTFNSVLPLLFIYVKRGSCKLEWVWDSVYHEHAEINNVYDKKYNTFSLDIEENRYIFLNTHVKYQISSARKNEVVIVHTRMITDPSVETQHKRQKTIHLCKPEFCPISKQSLVRLRPGEKLNDEIVDRYTMLLNEQNYERKFMLVFRCDIFRTYYKSASIRDTKSDDRHCFPEYNFQRWFNVPYGEYYDDDRLNFEYFSVPINVHDGHWTVAILDMRKDSHNIFFYDSYYEGCKYSKELIKFYIDLKLNLQICRISREDVQIAIYKGPKQSNGHDCGVYMLMCIEYYFDNKKLNKFSGISHTRKDILEKRSYIHRKIDPE